MLGGFFFDWRNNQKPFTSLTFERGVDECNLSEHSPVHLSCARVSGDFLPTLGISPALGRNFLAEEDEPNGPKVALISNGLWLNRFNRDPGVLNKLIDIDGSSTRIIGVLPKDFEMPRLQAADIVFPAAIDVAAQHTVNGGIGYPMWAFARLKPGVSIQQASSELQPLFQDTLNSIPSDIRKDFHPVVRSLRDRQMQDAYLVAWVLLGAVLSMLAIASANVASLFMARAASRERELAVRSALGASRVRLIRLTLTEAVLLALIGATCGVVLAEMLLRIFVAIAPTGMPFLAKASVDLRIVFISVLFALLCAVLIGVIPAFEKPRMAALAARPATSRTHARLRRGLVVAQIAISVVLLISSNLLFKSFRNLKNQDLGMQTYNVIRVRIPLSRGRYPTAAAYMDFFLRTESALRHLPGIGAVGLSDSLPPDGWHSEKRLATLTVEGKESPSTKTADIVVNRTVTPDYFRALHIPILEGRRFREEDRNSREHIMVISRLLALRLFGGEDPVGQHIQTGRDTPVYTVVGVARDVKNEGLAGQVAPEYYILRNNLPETWNEHCVFLIETSLSPEIVTPWLRSQITGIDPTVPVEFESLSKSVGKLADQSRFETALLGFFAICGMLMALIGLYGVISFVATQRTQEIGVRMALGASRFDILRLIVMEGVRLIALGLSLGLGAALIVTQFLKGLLFNVASRDAESFVGLVMLLAIVALAAILIPARAAMKVEPNSALRYE